MDRKNMQVLFAHRPEGWVQESDFHIVESDVNAPRAFIGMLRGENFGKQLVKLV